MAGSRFLYLVDKIYEASFNEEPYKHIYIENFFNSSDFEEIITSDEISTLSVSSDSELIEGLREKGYKVINFPGCITDQGQYMKWHSSKAKTSRTHSACEGFGMVMRLYEKRTKILVELEEFLLSEEFNRAIAEKFNVQLKDCQVDGGIQKYLDGYEISPHPDIRKKAATYMVNINPSAISEASDHHTHFLKFKPSNNYISKFWENNKDYDRDWVPWDWCETVKQQNKNNSVVIFSPSNDTMHGVKANYNHFLTQRTQLYGNLWYLNSETKPLKWEQLQIPSEALRPKANWKQIAKSYVPSSVKSTIRKYLNRKDGDIAKDDDIGTTNML
jgi:hypothetical protein